jgi:isoquinoline 1-oxidoreductase alpha subunit
MSFTLDINGTSRTGDVDSPLLWGLGDGLGMTGTGFGCGMARCGVCTAEVLSWTRSRKTSR